MTPAWLLLLGLCVRTASTTDSVCHIEDTPPSSSTSLNSLASLADQISDMNSKLGSLEALVSQASERLRSIKDKKLGQDIHYLETVLSCYHQCFHDVVSEEKRRRKMQTQRTEDLEATDSCLHGCMHLHPY